ncbi:TPA: hypothetical protein ACF2WY_005033, partial [Escherichia coli]
MNSSTKIALVITLLDAMGIGLIMPVLPTLLREFIASEDIAKEGANKQVISSQADSLIKISRSWADFFPANTSN